MRYAKGVFKSFTKEQGLADNVVLSIAQDRRGDVWIGTAGGLSRLRGEEIVSFSGTRGLGSDPVNALLSDHQGTLWVGTQVLNIGEFLPLRPRGLITSLLLPLNVSLAFVYVSRTPADKPIDCAALARWNSGRTRLALGGYGKTPLLGMDGTEAEGAETAARNASHEAGDEYASAEYRMEMAAALAKRCLNALAQ